MRFEDIEVAIEGVVADADAHTRLLTTIVAERDAALNSFFFECAVVLIHEEETWRRVADDIDVRPAILVEVRRDYGHTVTGPGLRESSCFRHVGEGAVAIVAIKRMPAEGQAARAAVDGHSFPVAVGAGTGPRHVRKVEYQIV